MFSDYKKLSVEFNDLDKFELERGPVYLTVMVDNIPFEFLINSKENAKKAIIFGSGAFNVEKMSPPIFNRHKWRDDFNNNTTIYYNDPTLYLGKLNLAWGYGNKDRHFLEDIATILLVITKQLSIENKDVLFYGSSGGGFKSLMLAAMLQGSKAFVNNPQTIITNYFKKFAIKLHETVYPNANSTDFPEFVSSRINVIELFKAVKYVPEIYYAQNLAVKHDVSNHLQPFIQGLSELNEEIFKNKITMNYYYHSEEGHDPMSKEMTIKIIKELMDE